MFHAPMENINAMSSLALAHVGDGVYELLVRTMLCRGGQLRQDTMHRETVRYVAAAAQSEAAKRILPLLSEEEKAVYNRARNAKCHASPAGCTVAQYHAATALEALFGWLWLRGDTARLTALFAVCTEENDAS